MRICLRIKFNIIIIFIETEFKVIADVDTMTEESFTSIKNLAESVLKWKKEQ